MLRYTGSQHSAECRYGRTPQTSREPFVIDHHALAGVANQPFQTSYFSNSNLHVSQSCPLIPTLLGETTSHSTRLLETAAKSLVIPEGERSEDAEGGLCFPPLT